MANTIQTAPAATNQQAAAGTGSGLVNINFPDFYQFFGIQQINWTDVSLRAGLILLGIIMIIIVLIKALSKPAVEITETAGNLAEE